MEVHVADNHVFLMEIKTSYITLENIRFYSFHGVLPQEEKVGGEYLVTVKAKCDISLGISSDDITLSVDYQKILETISLEMKIQGNLIENLAYRIGKRIFEEIPKVLELEITVEKISPPVKGNLQSAKVTLELTRSEKVKKLP